MKAYPLLGRTALVTGASSGIGKRQALAMACAGASVVLVARRETALAASKEAIEACLVNDEQLASQAHQLPYVHILPWDLSHRESVEDLAAEAAAFAPHGIDILCNTAGVNHRQAATDITLESWDSTINLNLTVPFFLARALVPQMQNKQWGRIINIASLQTRQAFTNGMAYGASKGGIGQLTRAMAESWSSDGINCNAIGPGFFPTELTAPVFNNKDQSDALAQRTAIGRNGQLEDLDGVTVFLASSASDYITGQILYVDGGFTAL